MYLIRRNNGIYYVEYSSNNKNLRVTTGSRILKDAKDFLKKFNPAVITQEAPIKSVGQTSINVSDFLLEYKSYVEAFKSKKYSQSVQSTIDFFNDRFSKRNLSEVINRDIEHLLISKYQDSKYSAFVHFRNLRAAFNKAIEWGYLKTNPVTKIKLPKIPKVIPQFIDDTQLQLIIENSRSHIYSDIYMFAYYTGMRRGEILNLRWSSVNFSTQSIHLANTLHFNTKNKKDRIIPMHHKVDSLLQTLSTRNRNTDFVFVKSNGFPFSQDVITANFKYAIRKAKLDDRIHFHSLRHSFASNLVQKGVSLVVIKELLGHEDIATTMIYSHVKEESLINAVLKL